MAVTCKVFTYLLEYINGATISIMTVSNMSYPMLKMKGRLNMIYTVVRTTASILSVSEKEEFWEGGLRDTGDSYWQFDCAA